jgi:hypothetical protein
MAIVHCGENFPLLKEPHKRKFLLSFAVVACTIIIRENDIRESRCASSRIGAYVAIPASLCGRFVDVRE